MQSRQITPTAVTALGHPDLAPQYALPISKLRGVPFQVRVALKVRRITTCSQLLNAAALHENRLALARATKLAPEILTELVQLADNYMPFKWMSINK